MHRISAIDAEKYLKVIQIEKKNFKYVSFFSSRYVPTSRVQTISTLSSLNDIFSSYTKTFKQRKRSTTGKNEWKTDINYFGIIINFLNALIISLLKINIFYILAFIDLQSCTSVVCRWIYGASILPRPQPFHQKLLANKKILTRMWLWSRIHLWFRLIHTFILILQIYQIC